MSASLTPGRAAAPAEAADRLGLLRAGGKAALARALAGLETAPDALETTTLLAQAHAAPRARVIGITGPPGVGKSTLVNGLITHWRAAGKTVGVIAIDPSSRRSGGALLGDRTRLSVDPEDRGVFVRSMAARDHLGGLAGLTVAAMVLMRALFDVVLIETVGVGQSETEVSRVVDTVVFCVQPGSGDSLQYMKAGIAEIPHLVVVTKADMTREAMRARADVEGALSLSDAEDDWTAQVLMVSARMGDGVDALARAIDEHGAYLAKGDRIRALRHLQAEGWLKDSVRERFGREGLRKAGPLALAPGESPFDRLAVLARELA
ncbi:ArgK/MeaB family GTPase [Rhodospirillum rubrum]|uniref:ArgK protein n=1 Tax=Rhodospirillum rubrum (strain ATCC 11170 / ATH 1.1.1 / DSM 467 / LMG 4362 / NCIMB 8255 / S1) TaxID=269796 RepID=Q2RQ54_RHORT|nr:GTP-binding protein [Rhodospirillum rubrum]ABC23741.1 ArgK protein [Rhodospirillum rubrum ATCC 11170]AEO49480.1 ArgK protein [Rhodospirillum rubrum F11]MBK5955417.1 methylmalonyl Co-A mutase-associated GTPase MeaB [Rhodospirillum rubrum]HAQ00879.1 methylmalonyl Co-A mutase-associated GTPase MeaB [Rhodospirillum rubrum]HCF16985.1 methylmalonyl Co-A mutase-associated GTPase MeaB [Rhodospirillum rubrum]